MIPNNIDLICFSHLRWGFVFQRPQHLMSRFARNRRVFFLEEPIYEGGEPQLRCSVCSKTGVRVLTPVLSYWLKPRSKSFRRRKNCCPPCSISIGLQIMWPGITHPWRKSLLPFFIHT